MSQNDFNLANQGFPSMRSDMNSALQALASNSAGATLPATTYAYQWWYDTTTNKLKMRNAANSIWIDFATFNQATGTFTITTSNISGLTATAAELNLISSEIGRPFPVLDHIAGCPIPSNAGTQKFIKLTAGLTGSGAYNNGLLSGESVSGTAPAITATATIVGGLMNGQTVALINTEQAFIRPSTASGVLQGSQNLAHTHPARVSMMEYIGTGGNLGAPAGSILQGYAATLSSGGDEARPRNRSATFYMRII